MKTTAMPKKSRTSAISLIYLVLTAILLSSCIIPLVNAETYFFVTSWGSYGSGNGEFIAPFDVAVDSSGYVYVADSTNDSVQKFTSDGVFVTSWGSTGTEDGQFRMPFDIIVDGSGYVYVADVTNRRVQKFTSDGVFVTTWGSYGSGNGEFIQPYGVAVDDSGYVYVADCGNDCVQKFTSDGVFVAKWGSEGSGDGEFGGLTDVAVDGSGYVYTTEIDHNRVQKFTSDGVFVTNWGNGGVGDGQFNFPVGVAVDGSGYVYVADYVNDRVQKFTSDGVFVAKWGSEGSGDGEFNYPSDVAVDGSGYVYVTDSYNTRVQKFTTDNTPPTGSITLAAGADYISSPTVTVGLSYNDDFSGVKDVRFSVDGVFDTEEWENPPLFKIWAFSADEGVKTLYFQVRDNAGNTAVFSDSVTLDIGPPTGSILINGGAASTTSAEVTLSLTYFDAGSGVSQVRYSNDGVWDAEPWESPSATKTWSLSGDNGPKTVYYQIKDNGGARSSTYSDDITLTTAVPTGSITINDGDTYTTSTSATLSLIYASSGSTVSQVRYSNDGVWDTEQWESPAATKAWTLTSGDGTKTVYYQVKNTEDWVSATYSDSIIFDTTPPTGAIMLAAGADVTAYQTVTVGVYHYDENGVNASRFSTDGVFDTEEWHSPPHMLWIWGMPSGDGVKTLYFQIMDNAGNTAVVSDSVIFDTTSPTGSVVIAGGEDFTGNPAVNLGLSYSDVNGVSDVRFSNDGVWDTEEWENPATSRFWMLSEGEGSKIVYFQVRDNAGNTDVFSDSITLVDGYAPYEEQSFNVTVGETDYTVGTYSNSTVSDLSFNEGLKRLRFSVNGTSGTIGVCNVTVPAELMSGDFTIYIDDALVIEGLHYIQLNNGTHYLFSINYIHSSHVVELFSTDVLADTTSPTAPTVSSSTHPDEDAWYSNNDPSFTWTIPADTSGIAGYSVTLSPYSFALPDEVIDTTDNTFSYTDVEDGEWYFHVRAVDNTGNWGDKDTYRIKIDTESEPSPSPSPTPSPSPSPSPSPTPSPSPSASPEPTNSSSPSPEPTSTPPPEEQSLSLETVIAIVVVAVFAVVGVAVFMLKKK